jgi:hypothetical protein
MSERKKEAQYLLRLDRELYEWLKATAKERDRSLNGEINFRLRKSLGWRRPTTETETAAGA